MEQLKTLGDLYCVLNEEISYYDGNKNKHYNPPSDTIMSSPHTRDEDLKQSLHDEVYKA